MSVREVPELMLTAKETARSMKLSESYIKKLIAARKIPSVKVGRSRRVRISDLTAYVANLPIEEAA
jgi:excisionase family DNA binding protein